LAGHALAGSGRDRLGLVAAVGSGGLPGLSATPGWLSAGLVRAGHLLGPAWLGCARQFVARPGAVPVTAVGRERASRPSAAPRQRDGAPRCGARSGMALPGGAGLGSTGLGPVTAVACGLVPQASAASERQSEARQGVDGPGRSVLAMAGQGTVRHGGRTVFCGVRLPAAHAHGSARQNWARLGTPRFGSAWHGAERHTSEFESLTGTTHGWAMRGRARQGRHGLGEVGSGIAGCGEVQIPGDWQTSRFESVTPTHTTWRGAARLGKARMGQALAGPGEAGVPLHITGVTHV
jgi:hypothetical protein